MQEFLGYLTGFPGDTWQERWEAAGHDAGIPVGRVAGDDRALSRRLSAAAGRCFAMRLIRPTLLGLRSNTFTRYTPWFRNIANDPWLEEFCERVDQLLVGSSRRGRAKSDVCYALTVFGIDLDGLTPEALLHYAVECRAHALAGEDAESGTFSGTLAWPVLHEMGQFPRSAPRTLRAAVTRGQLSIEEPVDRHQLRNREVRDLLVEYVRRRSAELDYSTLRHLITRLVKTFWKVIEEINPEQADLRLSEETFTQWKEKLLVLPGGKPRLDMDGPLLAVRSLYLDLHTWSVAEPERWAKWVAPCPVRDADLRHFQLRRRRLNERIANRTRVRQPLLPILSQHVNDTWHQRRELLKAAQSVNPGEEFVHDGTTWLRVSCNERHNRPPVRVVNRTTGDLVRVPQDENAAFWQWAVVETLRLAGLRAEKLTELSHLSVRQYQRPNGEVVALLVVSPSKSDRERVIPMWAELFHVITQVIRRHREEHGTVPVCARYDLHEKVWSEELPYLFQTVHSSSQRGMSSTTVWRIVRRACNELAATHPEFANVHFAPHDFRRLFATELVNNGLPIHIGAALLGHLDIRTTRGYVAVPYATPCAHEHACIRCPMLSINPKMLPRLDELEEDLLARRERAVAPSTRERSRLTAGPLSGVGFANRHTALGRSTPDWRRPALGGYPPFRSWGAPDRAPMECQTSAASGNVRPVDHGL